MSKLTDKAAFIKGLAEGMKLEAGNDESKLLLQIIDAIGEIAASVEELEESHDELSDFVDSIDEDLEELEDTLGKFEDLDDDDEDDDDEDEDEDDDEDDEDADDEACDGDCDACEGCDGANIYLECLCPECHAAFYTLESEMNDTAKFVCPRCGKTVVPMVEYEDEIPIAAKAEEDE